MPTSSLVPHVWPLAINGTEYALDDGAQVYEDRSIPTLRNVATGSTSDETTLNPERGFLRSFTSFKRGAGQTFRDADNSDNQRFRDSWHVEVFDDDAVIKPTAKTEKVGAGTITLSVGQQKMLAIDDDVYMTDGWTDKVWKIENATSTSPTITSVSTGGGVALKTLIAPKNEYLLASEGSDIYYIPLSLASATGREVAAADAFYNSLVYAHGTFLCHMFDNTGTTYGVFELSGDPTTAAFTASTVVHQETQAEFNASYGRFGRHICKADGGFYYLDGVNQIHYISVDNAGVLTYEGVRATLPISEGHNFIYEYLGFILVVAEEQYGRYGVRVCTQGTNGALTIGALLDEFKPFGEVSFDGNYAYVAIDSAAGDNRGTAGSRPIRLAKLDFTQIADGLVPAWAITDAYDGSGDGISDMRCFAVAAGYDGSVSEESYRYFCGSNNIYRTRTTNLAGTNFETDGWLSTGWVSWGIGDDKLLQEVAMDADSVSASYSLPADVDSYTAYTDGDEVTSALVDVKFTLTAATSEFRRATARAYPLTAPQREVTIPILLGDTVTDLRNVEHKRDPRAERDALVALEGTVVDLQEGQSTSVRALVTGHRWVGLNRENSGTFGGTLILTAKIL
jgi:hypothetical protein